MPARNSYHITNQINPLSSFVWFVAVDHASREPYLIHVYPLSFFDVQAMSGQLKVRREWPCSTIPNNMREVLVFSCKFYTHFWEVAGGSYTLQTYYLFYLLQYSVFLCIFWGTLSITKWRVCVREKNPNRAGQVCIIIITER